MSSSGRVVSLICYAVIYGRKIGPTSTHIHLDSSNRMNHHIFHLFWVFSYEGMGSIRGLGFIENYSDMSYAHL